LLNRVRYRGECLDNRDPEAIARVLTLIETYVQPYFRAEVRGVERIPASSALYVNKHNAGLLGLRTCAHGACASFDTCGP